MGDFVCRLILAILLLKSDYFVPIVVFNQSIGLNRDMKLNCILYSLDSGIV